MRNKVRLYIGGKRADLVITNYKMDVQSTIIEGEVQL